MADSDELSALRAENSRLIALLESHGIEWRARQQPDLPVVLLSHRTGNTSVRPRNRRRQVGLRASLRE